MCTQGLLWGCHHLEGVALPEGTQQDLFSRYIQPGLSCSQFVQVTTLKGSEVPVVITTTTTIIIIINYCILAGLLQVFLPVLSHCCWPWMGSGGTGAPLGVWEGLRMVSPSPCLSFLQNWEKRGGAALAKGFPGVQGERSKRPVPGNTSAPSAPNQQIQLMFNSHTKSTKPSPAWEPTGQTPRTRTAPPMGREPSPGFIPEPCQVPAECTTL